MKKIIYGVIIFFSNLIFAQEHYNSWFKTTMIVPINRNLKTDVEFMHRRQNGFDNGNLLGETLLYAIRPWLHYQLNENIKFSVSPIAYFMNYKIIQSEADESKIPGEEIRTTAAIELQKKLMKNLSVFNRNAGEYRNILNSNNITRLRNRLGIRCNLNPTSKIILFDEVLYNISGVSEGNFWDQNRVNLSLERQFNHHLKLEFGYMYIKRYNAKQHLSEHDVLVNFSYLFSKK